LLLSINSKIVIPVNWQMTLHAKGIAIAVPIHFYCFISIAYVFYRFFKLIKSNSFRRNQTSLRQFVTFFVSPTVTVLIFFFIRFMFMPVLLKSV